MLNKPIITTIAISVATAEIANVNEIIIGKWFAPYAEGMGLETTLESIEDGIRVQTGYVPKFRNFIIFTIFFSGLLFLGFLVVAYKASDLDYGLTFYGVFMAMLMLYFFGAWTRYLARTQHDYVVNTYSTI